MKKNRKPRLPVFSAFFQFLIDNHVSVSGQRIVRVGSDQRFFDAGIDLIREERAAAVEILCIRARAVLGKLFINEMQRNGRAGGLHITRFFEHMLSVQHGQRRGGRVLRKFGRERLEIAKRINTDADDDSDNDDEPPDDRGAAAFFQRADDERDAGDERDRRDQQDGLRVARAGVQDHGEQKKREEQKHGPKDEQAPEFCGSFRRNGQRFSPFQLCAARKRPGQDTGAEQNDQRQKYGKQDKS